MTPVCKNYDCDNEAEFKASGGVRPGEPHLGWSGHYCEYHLHEVVDVQLFQVTAGMPIKIEKA